MSFDIKPRIHMSEVSLDVDVDRCVYWISAKDVDTLPSMKFLQPIRSCEMARHDMWVDMVPRDANLILPRAQMYFGTQYRISLSVLSLCCIQLSKSRTDSSRRDVRASLGHVHR